MKNVDLARLVLMGALVLLGGKAFAQQELISTDAAGLFEPSPAVDKEPDDALGRGIPRGNIVDFLTATNSWRWPVFAWTYMTVLGYTGAFLIFQIGSRLI